MENIVFIFYFSAGSDSPDAKRQKSSGSPSVSSSSKVCLLLLSYISIHSSEAINIIGGILLTNSKYHAGA